jgi:hypothetical protein
MQPSRVQGNQAGRIDHPKLTGELQTPPPRDDTDATVTVHVDGRENLEHLRPAVA